MLWLALDLGTTGVKAALLETSGRVVRSAYRDYPTLVAEGRLEQQPEDWWRAVSEVVLELDARDAAAVALTGQMQDVILISAVGRPVRPAILYSDARAGREAAHLDWNIGGERLRTLTGNAQGAASVLAKLLWLETQEPDSLGKASHLLFGAADFIAFKLTGVAATDTTTASTTGLLELNSRTWLSVGEGLTHSAKHLLPTLVEGGAQVGTVMTDVATALGLRPDIPVHLGPGDAGATTLGAGSGEPGQPYAYLGTSGWIAFTALERPTSAEGMFTLAHPKLGYFICIAPLLTAGGNLDWLLELLAESDYEKTITRAAARPITPLLYLPYLNGERSPFNDPHARAAFIGLSAQHTRDDLTRALLEGVAFAYRHALDTLLEPFPYSLNLTGGGTRSAALCQLLADVLGIPVSTLADAAHIGLKGALAAALNQNAKGVAPASPHTFEVREFALHTFEPSKTASVYDEKYALFRTAYPALQTLFKALDSLPLRP